MSALQFTQLVQSLRLLPAETEWVEFKVNNTDPNEIGEYILDKVSVLVNDKNW